MQAKFFERVKIERMIDKAKKEAAKADSSAEVQAAAAAKLARLQEDLQVSLGARLLEGSSSGLSSQGNNYFPGLASKNGVF